MDKELGLAGRCGFVIVAVAVVTLPLALFFKTIDHQTFVAVAVLWLLVAAVMILGDSITEITVWKTSIKRDVRAAQEARKGAEHVLSELQAITRLVIENEFVLLSGSELAVRGHPSVQHVHSNLDELTRKIAVTGTEAIEWQQRMRNLMQQPLPNNQP